MSIKLALLSLLADHPRGVGQLRHDFEDITKHTWPVNVGQVFQTIQRLERDGLIAHHGSEIGETGRSADIYAITQAGRDVVHDWLTTEQSAERLLYERRIFDLEAEARWLDHVETLATPRKHDDNSI